MPTPVAAARQCLTPESVAALDAAVVVARRRGHAQTTSLHMVSSLLSLPNSRLREACTRTRNNAYTTRVQFKALELSLSVALDRLPSSQSNTIDEPPVSNSLMAAIRRSQANQRRQPENFTFYQQQQYNSSANSVPVVRVELQNLIVSILDDPLVSRVFGEAGFRSFDVKTATFRPGVFNCTSSRYKRANPPLFLCNLGGNSDMGRKGFEFPFMGCFSRDENSRKIGEVMVKIKRRNPIIVGFSAGEAVKGFLEILERRIDGVLPVGLSGLSSICVKDEILRFMNGDLDKEKLESRFDDVEKMAMNALVVLNLGDLKVFVDDCVNVDGVGVGYLVRRLGGLVEAHSGKLWLIGSVETNEVYFKFLNKFPCVEEQWDLQILPISPMGLSMGGSYPRSSLMDSFVPLGGFFSMPFDTKSPLRPCVLRCHLCNEKYEQEVAALSNGGICEQYQSTLPSWLQNAEQSGSDAVKAKDDKLLLSAKITGIQKKWDAICQNHHYNQTLPKGYTDLSGYPFPRVTGFQVEENKKENASKDTSNTSNASSDSRLSTHLQNSLSSPKGVDNPSIISKSIENPSKIKVGSNALMSSTSVARNLGVGAVSSPKNRESEIQINQTRENILLSRKCPSQYDPKFLYKSLLERVGHQEEAINAIIEGLSMCQMRSTREDIWLNFTGFDSFGKKKIGVALAEILYGSTESLIYADLSFQEVSTLSDTIFNSRLTNKYDVTMRETVVDYLFEKLSKRSCVVFLENVDKADLVVQDSLSHAVNTGRFKDLRGREVTIGKSIFLTTASLVKGRKRPFMERVEYSEDEVLRAKGRLIEIMMGFDLNDDLTGVNLSNSNALKKGFSEVLMNKRKLSGRSRSPKKAHKGSNTYLDLNIPADESQTLDACSDGSVSGSESDPDSNSKNSISWLDDFERQVNQTVLFKPFDFDSLAEKLFKSMSECLHEILGSECSLEIESKLMHQLLAASYLFDNKRVSDWIQGVLRLGFVEAIEKFSLDARSIVKIVTRESTFGEDQLGGLLPARIIMN